MANVWLLRLFSALLAAALLMLAPSGCDSQAAVLHARGNLRLRRGDVAGALRDLRAAAKAAPHSPSALLRLGQALYDAQRFSEAEDAYRRALRAAEEAGSAHAPTQRALAQLLARTGRLHEAENVLVAALAGAPEDSEARLALAHLRLHRGDLPLARADLEAVLDDHPRAPAALYGRARVALQGGDLAKAAELFTRAHKVRPQRPYGSYGLAVVAARRRQTGEACAHLADAFARGLADGRPVLRDRELRAAGLPGCVHDIWRAP